METTETKPKQQKGFAVLSAEKKFEIASSGGKAAHAMGRAYKWNSETAKAAALASAAKRKAAREAASDQ